MSEKPNIVLINCDDLGYGDPGCYGSKVHRTPAIDSMAEKGLRFTDFYMASPVCSPSRGAMMTGCYPPRIGFGKFNDFMVLLPGDSIGLNPEEITIAGILKNAGYRTMLVGKWHCGDQKEFLPTAHGFDSYYGLPYSNDMGRQMGQGRPLPPLPLMLDDEVIQEQPDQASLTERYTEQAVRFIRENRSNPFFLYLAHMHVHFPLYAPAHFLKNSINGPYGACVEAVDWSTGVILNELKQQGIDENTLVVFTSDNGSHSLHKGSNAPLRGAKATTWEGGQRVPCVMYWPGTISPGSVCTGIASSIDLYPTFSKLAGAKVPDDRIIDGLDISGTILHNMPTGRDTFFYYLKNDLEAARVRNWKLHVKKGNVKINELYDLSEDISESKNLYNDYPDVVDEIKERMRQCALDIGDEANAVRGRNIRPAGVVRDPVPLTRYDPTHPYIIAMYDNNESG